MSRWPTGIKSNVRHGRNEFLLSELRELWRDRAQIICRLLRRRLALFFVSILRFHFLPPQSGLVLLVAYLFPSIRRPCRRDAPEWRCASWRLSASRHANASHSAGTRPRRPVEFPLWGRPRSASNHT